jgi:hypothetical protein
MRFCFFDLPVLTYPNYMPVYRPGYIRRWVQTIIGIDAEMIVLK